MEKISQDLLKRATTATPSSSVYPAVDCVCCEDEGLVWGYDDVPFPVRVVCPMACQASLAYHGQTWREIYQTKRLAWLFASPKWAPYRKARLSQVPQAWRDAIEPVLRAGEGLYLYGPVGSGKTYLAIAALLALIASDRHLAFESVPVWVNTLKEVIADESIMPGGLPAFVSGTGAADVLLLDDLGTEQPTDFTAAKLYELFDERCSRAGKGITVITSNYSLDELPRAMGPQVHHYQRIVSRIKGLARPFKIDGPDRRNLARG